MRLSSSAVASQHRAWKSCCNYVAAKVPLCRTRTREMRQSGQHVAQRRLSTETCSGAGSLSPTSVATAESAPHANPSEMQGTMPPSAWHVRTRCWYPVGQLEELSMQHGPVKVDVLGRGLLVWSDEHGTWHCRPVPNTLLQTSSTTHANNSAYTKNTQCPESADGPCCPVQIAHGQLWVWPCSAEDSAAEAAATPVLSPPENSSTDRSWTWCFRELPDRLGTLFERMTEMASYAFMTQLVMDAVEAASSSVLVIGTVAACLAIRQAASAVAPMLQQSAHTAAHATASGMATPITRQATASLTDPVAAVTAGLAAVQQVFSDHAFFWVALITAVGCAAAFLRLQVFREWYYQEEYIPPPQDDDEE